MPKIIRDAEGNIPLVGTTYCVVDAQGWPRYYRLEEGMPYGLSAKDGDDIDRLRELHLFKQEA